MKLTFPQCLKKLKLEQLYILLLLKDTPTTLPGYAHLHSAFDRWILLQEGISTGFSEAECGPAYLCHDLYPRPQPESPFRDRKSSLCFLIRAIWKIFGGFLKLLSNIESHKPTTKHFVKDKNKYLPLISSEVSVLPSVTWGYSYGTYLEIFVGMGPLNVLSNFMCKASQEKQKATHGRRICTMETVKTELGL